MAHPDLSADYFYSESIFNRFLIFPDHFNVADPFLRNCDIGLYIGEEKLA